MEEACEHSSPEVEKWPGNIESDSATLGETERETVDPKEGVFLSWGCGEFGQHCHEVKEDVSSEKSAVSFFCGSGPDDCVRLTACGSSHTLVVTESNEVFAWGNGSSGQLGLGGKDCQQTPQRVLLYANQVKPAPVQGIACGGRHSFVWLENGQMFSFGNNFYAQLGYDFRIKNFKENQFKPHLIHTLSHRVVQHVACGQKHTMFLFKDGAVAGVGSNSHGQIGTGDVKEAIVPKFNEDLRSVRLLSCGANHTLVVQEDGSLYMWGFSRACGSRTKDVLSPILRHTRHDNIIALAAGGTHSVFLTANGNIYTWGAGVDGQLGHGDAIRFLSQPKRVRHPSLRGHVTTIDCGESFTAVVTSNGSLFMFGRNSHCINAEKPASAKILSVQQLDTGGFPVKHVTCGAWHVTCMSGHPVWVKSSNESDVDTEDEVESLLSRRRVNSDCYISDEGDLGSGFSSDTDDVILPPLGKSSSMMRDKTSVSLADFYAPTPDGRRTGLDLIQEQQEVTPRSVPASPRAAAGSGGGWKRTYFPRKSLSSDSIQNEAVVSQLPNITDTNDVCSDCDNDTSVLVGDKWPSSSCEKDGDGITGVLLSNESESSKDLSRLPGNQEVTLPVADNVRSSKTKSELNDLKTVVTLIPAQVSGNVQRSKTVVNSSTPMGPLQFSSKRYDRFDVPRQNTVISSKTVQMAENVMVAMKPYDGDPHKPVNTEHRLEVRQQQSLEKARERQLRVMGESRGRGKLMRMKRDAAAASGPMELQGIMGNVRHLSVARTSSDSSLHDMRDDLQNLSVSSKPPLPKNTNLPKPVSFVGGAAKRVIKKRPVNFGQRSFTQQSTIQARNNGFAIKVENPRQKPIYSSASSWKNEADILLLGSGNKVLENDRRESLGSNSAPAALNRASRDRLGVMKREQKTSSDDSSQDEGDNSIGHKWKGLQPVSFQISNSQSKPVKEPARNTALSIKSFPPSQPVPGSSSSR